MKKHNPYRKSPEREELKYYGFHACLKLWEARADDIIRIYVEEQRVKEVSALLKWCAKERKTYHIVSAEEISKVANSVHHEGLCVLAKELPTLLFSKMLQEIQKTQDPLCILYLDGVQNPHNIGSIMRVCAHFGVSYIIGHKALLPKISPSAYRVAQGGAEYVKLVALENVKDSFLKLQKEGFHSVTTSSHGKESIFEYRFSPRTIIVMGSESDGVKTRSLASIKETVVIPGSGFVESLNVSVATGLILGEYYKQATKDKFTH